MALFQFAICFEKGGRKMQTVILYGIGILAVSYMALTVWKNVKGQGSCCGGSGKSSGCGGCGSATNCK